MKAFATILISALIFATQSQATEQADIGLVSLVDQVSTAADRRDFESLRSLMVLDFRYSFGGNRSRDEAIEWYKDRPKILNELASVLSCGSRIFMPLDLIASSSGAGEHC